MAASYERLGRSVLDLETDQTGLDRGLNEAKAKAQNFATTAGASLATLGASMTKVGRTMTTNVTLPVIAAGAAVFHFGADFDQTMGQIVGLAGVPKEAIGGIREEILGMAEAVGRTPQELAEAFYFVASAGFTADEAMDVLNTSARAAAAGLGTTQDVAKVLGLTINAYGKENITAAHAADVLVAAVRDGTAEASDLAGVLGTVVPTAALLGVGFDQVTASLAGMTITGLSAEEASVSLNQVLLSLLNPSREGEKALAAMGTSAGELRAELKEKGLLTTLRDLETRFQGNDEAATAVFGNVRALRGALALLGLDQEQLNDIFADTSTALGDLGFAYDATEGPAREAARANAALQVELIRLGEDVLPLIVDVLHGVVDVVQLVSGAFRSLPQPVRAGIVQLLAIAAVVGPVVLVLGKLTSGLGLLFTAFGRGALLMPKVVTLFMGLGKALAGTALAQSLGAGLAAAIGQVAALPVVASAVTGMSTAVGALMAAAIPAAMVGLAGAIGIGLALAVKAAVFDPGLQQQTRDIGTSIDEQIATGVGDLEQSKAALETGIAKIKAVPFGDFLYGDQIRDLQAQLDRVNAELAAKAAELPEGVVTALEYGQSEVDVSARMMVSGIGAAGADELAAQEAQLQAAGAELPGAVAQGIRDARQTTLDAWNQLVESLKTAITPAREAGQLVGRALGTRVAKALNDERPEVQAAAQNLLDVTLARLTELGSQGASLTKRAAQRIRDGLKSQNPTIRANAKAAQQAYLKGLEQYVTDGGKLSKEAAAEVNRGLKSKNGAIRATAQNIKNIAAAPLKQLSNQTYGYGQTTGREYADGIRSSKRWITQAARNAAMAAAAIFATHSPPGPESPLHEIDRWGFRTMAIYYESMLQAAGAYQPRLRASLSGAAGLFGAPRLGMPVLGAPAALGAISGGRAFGMTMAAAHHAGDTYHTTINAPIQGVLEARSVKDVQTEMRRLGELGVVPARHRSPKYRVSDGAR